jgi:hypothetical protein
MRETIRCPVLIHKRIQGRRLPEEDGRCLLQRPFPPSPVRSWEWLSLISLSHFTATIDSTFRMFVFGYNTPVTFTFLPANFAGVS